MPEKLSEVAPAPSTPDEIRAWLTDRVGYYLERPADTIDRSTPLSQYGLDSVYAFSLCGDIEDLLKIGVDPTLVWDYRTVDALTDYLTEKVRLG